MVGQAGRVGHHFRDRLGRVIRVRFGHHELGFLHEAALHEQGVDEGGACGTWGAALLSTIIGTELPGAGTTFRETTIRFSKSVAIGTELTGRVTVTRKDASDRSVTLASLRVTRTISPRVLCSVTYSSAERPASKADSNMYPEIRVSLPIRTWLPDLLPNTRPAAQPSLSTNLGVMEPCPTRPRMPSVPK